MTFKPKLVPWIFLLVGFLSIFALTYIKHSAKKESTPTQLLDNQIFFTTLPKHYSEEIFCDSSRIYISKLPITYSQFQDFVWETDYMTWRESNMRFPNWRYPDLHSYNPSLADLEQELDPDPSSPALWLTPSDAMHYCKWVALRQEILSPYDQENDTSTWKKTGCRLPTTNELEILYEKFPRQFTSYWEWTANTLDDMKNGNSRARNYKTAWKPKSNLRHRRIEDLGDKEEDLTCFRVAWSIEDLSNN